VTHRLPDEFVARLRDVLGDELPDFVAAASQPHVRGLRRNARKVSADQLDAVLGVPLEPVPWCETGFRLPGGTPLRLGDHPAHRAGLFYLQEPSAMSPAEILARGLAERGPGAAVIDLAAAPGGKTTRLTELVGPDGVVVANEVERSRLGALHQNLDRWGAANVVTCSRPIADLARLAPASFDGVLLDAPCTGEGMFRRDPEAIRHWSVAAVHGSARRQARLLAEAGKLVAPGGVLVYSTCTFAVEENEERIAAFVADHPGWTIEDCTQGFARGRRVGDAPTDRTARLWPHRLAGEGHFVALLRRDATPEPAAEAAGRERRRRARQPKPEPAAASWRAFAKATVPELVDLPIVVRGDRVFARPATPSGLPDDVLTRPGLPLGRARPGRFEPAQALAGYLDADRVVEARDWTPDDPRWHAYVSGAEIPDTGPDGWVLVCAYGWGVGWARRRGNQLKNFLPQALRSQPDRAPKARRAATLDER
jgi:16S rRNA C967 or C1407 C5-methylase (RsmB/RsmF family)/NOL1/NOP2/fmu family ribosome biogenesis protein